MRVWMVGLIALAAAGCKRVGTCDPYPDGTWSGRWTSTVLSGSTSQTTTLDVSVELSCARRDGNTAHFDVGHVTVSDSWFGCSGCVAQSDSDVLAPIPPDQTLLGMYGVRLHFPNDRALVTDLQVGDYVASATSMGNPRGSTGITSWYVEAPSGTDPGSRPTALTNALASHWELDLEGVTLGDGGGSGGGSDGGGGGSDGGGTPTCSYSISQTPTPATTCSRVLSCGTKVQCGYYCDGTTCVCQPGNQNPMPQGQTCATGSNLVAASDQNCNCFP